MTLELETEASKKLKYTNKICCHSFRQTFNNRLTTDKVNMLRFIARYQYGHVWRVKQYLINTILRNNPLWKETTPTMDGPCKE